MGKTLLSATVTYVDKPEVKKKVNSADVFEASKSIKNVIFCF
jgi:hypothetical protein